MTGEELAEWRRQHDVTQEQLAVKLGVHRTTVARWEDGRPQYTPPRWIRWVLPALERELAAG